MFSAEDKRLVTIWAGASLFLITAALMLRVILTTLVLS